MSRNRLLIVLALLLVLVPAAAAKPKPTPTYIGAPNGGVYYYPLPAGFHRVKLSKLPGFTEPTTITNGATTFTVAEYFLSGNLTNTLVKHLYPTAKSIPSPKLWEVRFRALQFPDGRLGYIYQVDPYLITVVCRGASTKACRSFTLTIQTAIT